MSICERAIGFKYCCTFFAVKCYLQKSWGKNLHGLPQHPTQHLCLWGTEVSVKMSNHLI